MKTTNGTMLGPSIFTSTLGALLLTLGGCAANTGAQPTDDPDRAGDAPSTSDGSERSQNDVVTVARTAGDELPSVMIAGEPRRFIRVQPSAGDGERALAETDGAIREGARPEASDVSMSIRNRMTPVRNQGNRGTCAEFASTGLIEYYTGGDISEQAMVYFNGGNGGAAYYYRLGDFLTKGLVDERLSEYDPNDMTVHVPASFNYAQLVARSALARNLPLVEVIHNVTGAAALTAIKTSLNLLQPVGFGLVLPDGSMTTGNVATPSKPTCGGVAITAQNIGNCPGHAMIITGYDDVKQTFEIKNQWGTGWGNGGYGQMTYDFFVRYQSGPIMTLANDVSPPATITSIQSVYENTIGRQGMSWEVDAWVTNLTHGWTLASMNSGFLTNAQSTDAINAVYENVFGRVPASWEVADWQTYLASDGWTIPKMRSAFAMDPQNQAAVAQVYQDVLGRAPTAAETTTWRANIATGGWTIPMIRNNFALSTACAAAIDAVYESVGSRHGFPSEIAMMQENIHDKGWTIASMRTYLQNL